MRVPCPTYRYRHKYKHLANMAEQLVDPLDKVQVSGDGKQAALELDPWPEYINTRIVLWDKYMKQYQQEIANKTPENIKITLPDGKIVDGLSWRTTPFHIAQGISQGLAESTIVAKVDDQVYDLDRVLEKDCTLQLLKFDNDEAKAVSYIVFWHSSAHILGQAMERHYGGCLCYGPPIEDGYYYDSYMEGHTVKEEDFSKLDTIFKSAVKEKQKFERLELTKEELLDMFRYNPFKVRILQEKVSTRKTTVYRNGPLIDLCRGPHVRHTGKIKAAQVVKASSAYWNGDATAETLQRIYGISFPEPKMLKEWKIFREEAAKRDHRRLGKEQELFFFDEMSPGSAFFFPRGAHLYNTLVQFLRKEYRRRGYKEVITPNIYNSKLWETSGHWQHYSDNMFKFTCEDQTFALKPMNCPGHCLMFQHKPRTHKELPLRYADFGVLHRNELSGALTGLVRVRRFQQDDAHHFCRMDQITHEIMHCLKFFKYVYHDVFGFQFKLLLSTRPEKKYLGKAETWAYAEEQLTSALNDFGEPWSVNPGDGAFYGPKIDITIVDALRRSHQCATIQLDFQLPERFDLNYTDEKGAKHRPVMVHRAILGSVERILAVLTENYGGKWPFWLSPRQAMIVNVQSSVDQYADQVQKKIYEAGFECDMDLDPTTSMNKKIRNYQLAQYNFILVIGEQEMEKGTVNVRTRDNKVHGEVQVDELILKFQRLKDNKVKCEEEF